MTRTITWMGRVARFGGIGAVGLALLAATTVSAEPSRNAPATDPANTPRPGPTTRPPIPVPPPTAVNLTTEVVLTTDEKVDKRAPNASPFGANYPVGKVKLTWGAPSAMAIKAGAGQDGPVSIRGYRVYQQLLYPGAGAPTTVDLPATATSYEAPAPLHVGLQYFVSTLGAGRAESARVATAVTRLKAPTNARIWGFADTHGHQFVQEAHGGGLVVGEAYGPHGEACAQKHGALGGWATGLTGLLLGPLVGGTAFGAPGEAAGMFGGGAAGVAIFGGVTNHTKPGGPIISFDGPPTYETWPRYDTLFHNIMWAPWLQRAFLGGLRLLVMPAVNNESLCDVGKVLGTVPNATHCNDADTVGRQIAAARRMEADIDEDCRTGFSYAKGCVAPGRGWYHVVESPAQARAVINEGGLAVVLGIEVDHLFSCGGKSRPCTGPEISAKVIQAQQQGIRHVFPIHLSDNQFGGMAIYGSFFGLSSWRINGRRPVQITNCGDQNVDFQLMFAVPRDDRAYNGSGGHCNAQGLTPDGKFLITELAKNHMIIDIDHMSTNAVRDTFTLVNPSGYPVISGHNYYRTRTRPMASQHVNDQLFNRDPSRSTDSELFRTDQDVTTIHRLGGISAVGLHDIGPVRQTSKSPLSSIANACDQSDRVWYQHYAHAVSLQGGWGSAKVPFGSDQGLTGMPGPRFGPDACKHGELIPSAEQVAASENDRRAQGPDPRTSPAGVGVHYPITVFGPGPEGSRIKLDASVVGARRLDFNVDGFAHIGAYPDLIADLAALLTAVQDNPQEKLAPIFRSAEGYIEMWEKAERTKLDEHLPPPTPLPTVDLRFELGGPKTARWVIVRAYDTKSHVPRNGQVYIQGGPPSSWRQPRNTGEQIPLPKCAEVEVLVDPPGADPLHMPSGHAGSNGGVKPRVTKKMTIPCPGYVTIPQYDLAGFEVPEQSTPGAAPAPAPRPVFQDNTR